jgi:hypothetical protein
MTEVINEMGWACRTRRKVDLNTKLYFGYLGLNGRIILK